MSTIDYYNKNAKEYFNNTINADMSEAYEKFVKYLPIEGKIIDIGCGSGRDTLIFQNMGYEVEAIDGSEEMCTNTKKLTGINVRCLDFANIDYDGEFIGAWACASLLHVKKSEMLEIFSKIKKSLVNDGVFYVSYKYGDEEHEVDGKHYSNYEEEGLKDLILKSGFQLLEMWISGDKLKRDEKWINAVCKSIENV